MRNLLRRLARCRSGATLVEFALAALPVSFFIFGIMQTAYIVWVNNALQTSVNAAARCGALSSPAAPCDMFVTATQVFSPLPIQANMFIPNIYTCSSDGTGLVGTYHVTIGLVISLTLTAQSCYPTIPIPPIPS